LYGNYGDVRDKNVTKNHCGKLWVQKSVKRCGAQNTISDNYEKDIWHLPWMREDPWPKPGSAVKTERAKREELEGNNGDPKEDTEERGWIVSTRYSWRKGPRKDRNHEIARGRRVKCDPNPLDVQKSSYRSREKSTYHRN